MSRTDEEWTRDILRTGEADKKQVKEIIERIYQQEGLTIPPVLWFDSPFQVALAQQWLRVSWRNVHRIDLKLPDALSTIANLFPLFRIRQRDNVFTMAEVGRRLDEAVKGGIARDLPWTELPGLFFPRLAGHSMPISYYEDRAAGTAFMGGPGGAADLPNPGSLARNLRADAPILIAEVHYAALYQSVALLSERPTFAQYDIGLTKVLLRYKDGSNLSLLNNVAIPGWYFTTPSARAILIEPNAEARRVMMEDYGYGRIMAETDSKIISKDDWGELRRLETGFGEPLVMVKVVNSTPEPDGSYKDYWLRVDPNCRTAKQAVAWTFNMTEKEYDLTQQT